MTIYSINKGIGWSSSGVEYAQLYRAKVFRKLGVKCKFIFTDLIVEDNIGDLVENIGFRSSEVIWLYMFFTDFSISKSTFSLSQFEKTIPSRIIHQNKAGNVVRYTMTDGTCAIVHLVDSETDILKNVEFSFENKVCRKDFYSYKKYMTEYYQWDGDRRVLVQRVFYNTNGTVAYTETLRSDGDSLFSIGGNIVLTKESLVGLMLRGLNLVDTDLILLDRSTGIGQAVVENKSTARLGCVIHAEHFNEQATDEQHVLWNNFYEYQLQHSDFFDFYITATDIQKNILSQQFLKYRKRKCKVYSIPVGNIDRIQRHDIQKKAFISVSRLAPEKHIDWLVEAFIRAHDINNDITLDIYGEGSEKKKIQKIINDNGASDYIKLRGHHRMSDTYRHYSIYISASTSEGFGLTLMEALGCGLAFVGFDVRYGNRNFIKNKKNGLLVKYSMNDSDDITTSKLSQAITKLMMENISDYSDFSYRLAERYEIGNVQNQWRNLLELEKIK
ncbi:accessory Sec system glycosyltransferase GtfA [Lactiplantibacillus plantarum]|uniref:accessory Sec system glycosyltransferase GtfA n=1 Tax=Lactiplantibacillus plantarum TaxID=1590 RepID=UPI002002DACC|nr:accessory Sec system glycosyltransferase GtfA [Lactiplantibacillus plantarum]MCK6240587.1 accessory Sec system glycosyltransferase GtfA [Lactiplantibacillus plantarum]